MARSCTAGIRKDSRDFPTERNMLKTFCCTCNVFGATSFFADSGVHALAMLHPCSSHLPMHRTHRKLRTQGSSHVRIASDALCLTRLQTYAPRTQPRAYTHAPRALGALVVHAHTRTLHFTLTWCACSHCKCSRLGNHERAPSHPQEFVCSRRCFQTYSSASQSLALRKRPRFFSRFVCSLLVQFCSQHCTLPHTLHTPLLRSSSSPPSPASSSRCFISLNTSQPYQTQEASQRCMKLN